MDRQQWTDHIFKLDLDPAWAGNILTRARDTEIRLKHYCKGLTDDQLSFQPNGTWSIKEHMGHLIDLEPLFYKRLKELEAFEKELVGADMSNAKTHAANHNSRSLEALLEEFSSLRRNFIGDFLAMPAAAHKHAAMHPRLHIPMKPVDLLFFIAEHDDHHLATIFEIIVDHFRTH